jgi:hypothetical protein
MSPASSHPSTPLVLTRQPFLTASDGQTPARKDMVEASPVKKRGTCKKEKTKEHAAGQAGHAIWLWRIDEPRRARRSRPTNSNGKSAHPA